GAADPEMSLTGLGHFDHALLQNPCSHHDAMDLKAASRGQRRARALDFRDEQGDLGRATERLFARHASSPRKTTSPRASDGRVEPSLAGRGGGQLCVPRFPQTPGENQTNFCQFLSSTRSCTEDSSLAAEIPRFPADKGRPCPFISFYATTRTRW